MNNCKKYKSLDDALVAWQIENGKVYSKNIPTLNEAIMFMEWLFEDDGTDMVNSPKHYKLADGRDLQDIFWEVSSYGAAYFCKFNAAKYDFRRGKKDLAPISEDVAKADWYIKDVCKHTGHSYSEIRSAVDEILDKAYSVKKRV